MAKHYLNKLYCTRTPGYVTDSNLQSSVVKTVHVTCFPDNYV